MDTQKCSDSLHRSEVFSGGCTRKDPSMVRMQISDEGIYLPLEVCIFIYHETVKVEHLERWTFHLRPVATNSWRLKVPGIFLINFFTRFFCFRSLRRHRLSLLPFCRINGSGTRICVFSLPRLLSGLRCTVFTPRHRLFVLLALVFRLGRLEAAGTLVIGADQDRRCNRVEGWGAVANYDFY